MTRSSSTLAVLSVLAASVLGVILARTIPSAVFPEIIFRRATILADSGDLPAEQMLASVTRPLEESAYSVVGVTIVRSTTTRGSAEIDVTFGEDSDPQVSFQMLSAAVAHTRAQLPTDTTVDAVLLTTGTFPIVDISLSSKIRSLPELTDLVNYDLVPSLHRIDGTYRVGVIGGKYREFVVRLDPARMLQHDLSPGDVVAGLAKNNVVASAGRMNESHRMLLTVVTTDLHQAGQIAAVPLTATGGQPVRVSDVGSVELGIQEDYIRAASENGPSVLVGISRRPSGSTEAVAAEARQILAEFRQRYPDVQFSISYDQSALVAESLKSVRDAIMLGLALSVLVVLAFTMSPLSALVAAIVVPCTVAITFIVMKAAGLTFNMMTLGGLAAGIGLFIDDAIVMIEAIHRELAGGKSAAEAVAAALKSLRRPLIASTMTVIVVSGRWSLLRASPAFSSGRWPRRSAADWRFRWSSRSTSHLRWNWRSRDFAGVRAKRANLSRRSDGISDRGAALHPHSRAGNSGRDRFVGRGVLRLQQYRHGLSAAARRRRVHPRLHHAAAEHDGRHDCAARLDSVDSEVDPRGRRVQPPDRHSTWLFSDRIESRRHVGAAEGGPQTRYRRSHRFDSRAHPEFSAGRPGRVLASIAGFDRRFVGRAGANRSRGFGPDQKTIEATARQVAERMRAIHGLVDVFDGIVESIPEQAVVVDNTSAAHYGLSAEILAGRSIW